jgi:hypothetical protein
VDGEQKWEKPEPSSAELRPADSNALVQSSDMGFAPISIISNARQARKSSGMQCFGEKFSIRVADLIFAAI